jgi:hypothetical protein
MNLPRISSWAIAAACLLAVGAVQSAGAEEKPVGTYGEVRTTLAFKLPDAKIQKLLPEGWQSAPIAAGPSKDANLAVAFIDWLTVLEPDGKPGPAARTISLTLPARKKGTEEVAPLVFAGLTSDPGQAPGPYSVYPLAKVTVDRHLRTDDAGASTQEESWQFTGEKGDSIELQVKFVRGVAALGKVEVRPHSAIKPDFYRIYRIEQAVDVVRSAVAGVDRVQSYAFKASGGQLSQLFDGSEQLVSITSLPWDTRVITLPATQ